MLDRYLAPAAATRRRRPDAGRRVRFHRAWLDFCLISYASFSAHGDEHFVHDRVGSRMMATI